MIILYGGFRFTGNGIINADGDLWKIQRKAGLRFFSNSNLKILIENILPHYLEETVEKKLNAAVKSSEQVDLQELFLGLTTRLMGVMAYDVSGAFPHVHPSRIIIMT